MNENNKYTEEEIRAMAVKFFNENIATMFPPNIICENCGAENCSSNESCINCGLQL